MNEAPASIIGAGLAGLIAAHAWPRAAVYEAQAAPRAMHAALLRFRSDAVGRAVGIAFRRVRVHKGIWQGGAFHQPNIRLANLYARKVLSGAGIADRSIWNLDPCDRYIAPETLYAQLVDAVGPRIHWGTAYPWASGAVARRPVVSTAPMPATLAALYPERDTAIQFERAPITVSRYRVRGFDLFQTVYFPTEAHSVYRASITGSLLIVESAGGAAQAEHEWWKEVEWAFALPSTGVELIDRREQRYGKIAPIDESIRRSVVFGLTHDHNVYSLGRFATWRNILLDDVLADIDVIRRLLHSPSNYANRLASAASSDGGATSTTENAE